MSESYRARNFACVVYPESAPADWLDILSESKAPVFVSPLHDSDVNPGGESKKPHYHILVAYDGKKSENQARAFFESFGGVGCESVQSLRGYARYLCHLDNPEKFQYPIDQVRAFGGLDYVQTIGLPTDKYKALREMMQFCREHRIVSYAVLADYAADNHFDWFRVLADSGSVFMREYLKSVSWTMSQEPKIDPETGEYL